MQIVHDNGSLFVGEIFDRLCQRLGMVHIKTAPFRPPSNQTERVNRKLSQMIFVS